MIQEAVLRSIRPGTNDSVLERNSSVASAPVRTPDTIVARASLIATSNISQQTSITDASIGSKPSLPIEFWCMVSLGLASAALLAIVACFKHLQTGAKNSGDPYNICQLVESLPVLGLAEIEEMMLINACGGRSHKLVRIQAVVHGPLGRAAGPEGLDPFISPFVQRPCVLCTSVVSRQLHDGPAVFPVAFKTVSTDFSVSLDEHPNVKICIKGPDVSLFAMQDGHYERSCAFADAPEGLQGFVFANRTLTSGVQWQTNEGLTAEKATLNFQEYALMTGALVTLVGEFHIAPDGWLWMSQPAYADSIAQDPGFKMMLAQSKNVWSRAGRLGSRWLSFRSADNFLVGGWTDG